MQGLEHILKNFSWMAADQVARTVAGVLIGIWIARHLGPNDYGALSLALALSSLVGVFATLGLNRAVVRELTLHANEEKFVRRIVASTLVWRLLFSILCYVATVTISLVFDQGNPLLVGIVSATLAFTSFDVIDLYFQSKTASRYCVLARSVSFFGFLCIKVGLLLGNSGVLHFAVVTTLEAMGNALALWWAIRAFGIKLSAGDIDMRYGWSLIAQSWPELFAGFACLVFMRIDQIMVGNVLGDEAAGQYAVASRLAEAWYFIPSALVASSFPAIVRQRRRDRVLYLKRIHQLLVVLVAISYVVAVAVTFLAPWAITKLFGQAYTRSADILVVLVWSGLFVSLGVVSGSWIMAEAKPILNLTRNVIGAVTNVAFNLYLLPRYGTVGAAVGTLLSLSFAYLLSDFLNPQTRHIGMLKLKAIFLICK
ncbi:flippase [Hydrogenophilus thermoluteolus]|uniref:Polysaccharide biosynthesis protein n=1 Tax=Hydrogenophilus thermoluteolus TaxID=297 RepID=A0A2Z6E0E2_HYDTE|nr:flippase [Hydrogenophilus thermoluteolus]BBD78256.1 polysaccharide biosynthesis protein [Hydrogenophilus thermoluteolus]